MPRPTRRSSSPIERRLDAARMEAWPGAGIRQTAPVRGMTGPAGPMQGPVSEYEERGGPMQGQGNPIAGLREQAFRQQGGRDAAKAELFRTRIAVSNKMRELSQAIATRKAEGATEMELSKLRSIQMQLKTLLDETTAMEQGD